MGTGMPRGMGACSCHTPPSSHATDTRQHCVFAKSAQTHENTSLCTHSTIIQHVNIPHGSNRTHACSVAWGYDTHVQMQTIHNISKPFHLVLLFSNPTSPHNGLTALHSQAHPLPFLYPQHLHLGTLSSPRAGTLCFSHSHQIPPTASSPFVYSFAQNILVYYSPSERSTYKLE